MKIKVETILHRKQRYNTVGDFGTKRGIEWYTISKMKEIYQRAIFLHEFVEYIWVKQNGVSTKLIDAFDKLFEKEYKAGIHTDDEEPGDDKRAPYHKGHQKASAIEKYFIYLMGENWENYERACNKLFRPKK